MADKGKITKSTKSNQVNTTVSVEVQEQNLVANHGENLRHYRTAKRLSQEFMAGVINLAQPRYSDLEKLAIIDDMYLIPLAEALNLGIEWIKDIPLQKGYNSYHQDGNGNTNFQNTGDVNYTNTNDLKELKEGYESALNILKEALAIAIQEKKEILEKFTNFLMSFGKFFQKDKENKES